MPSCDVCLGEARDVGVFKCNHSVCRACGVSQSSCLVCTDVGGTKRRRITTGRLLQRARRPSDPHPERAIENAPKLQDRAVHTAISNTPEIGPAPRAESSQSPELEPERSSPPDRSTTPDSDNVEPPLKLRRTQAPKSNHSEPERAHASNASCGMQQVHAPSAFDEVRCELRPLGSAPKIQRAALRTTGKLPVTLLVRYIRERLELSPAQRVIVKCCDEELTDAMTLGDLVTYVWPSSEGHMVLDYEIPSDTDN